MLTDKEVLNYGLKKALELELLFLSKLRMYEKVSTGGVKRLIVRLITQETAHIAKLKELLDLMYSKEVHHE